MWFGDGATSQKLVRALQTSFGQGLKDDTDIWDRGPHIPMEGDDGMLIQFNADNPTAW